MATHNDLGNEGEELAVQHLLKNGWKILERNWRFGREEIDIIAQKKDTIAVVEVKTRFSNFLGEPYEAVSKSKQKSIIRAANHFIEKHDLDLEVQFDIISIILNKNQQKITHIEEAFSPRW
jgi:putative endonuclease